MISSAYANDHRRLITCLQEVCSSFASAHGSDAVDEILTSAANEAAKEAAIAKNISNARGVEGIKAAMHDTSGAEILNTVLNGGKKGVIAMMNALFSGHIPTDQNELVSWLSKKLPKHNDQQEAAELRAA